MKRPLLRDQQTVTLSTSSLQLAPGNIRRESLIVASPPDLASQSAPATARAAGVDTSTTGVKLTYTVPTGRTGLVTFASFRTTAGVAPTAALEVIVGGVTVTVEQGTVNVTVQMGLTLAAGDTVRWNVTVAGAGSTSDFLIGVVEAPAPSRITLSFKGTAVLDEGVNLYPGDPPLVLGRDEYADALMDPITAIASSGTPKLTYLDLFCPCGNDQQER